MRKGLTNELGGFADSMDASETSEDHTVGTTCMHHWALSLPMLAKRDYLAQGRV